MCGFRCEALDFFFRLVLLIFLVTSAMFVLCFSEHDACVTQVQALRGEMRGAYSEILGMDPEFCASKDVELLLWKNCYYKRIEVTCHSG